MIATKRGMKRKSLIKRIEALEYVVSTLMTNSRNFEILFDYYFEKAEKYYGESFHKNIKIRMADFHGVRIHQDGVRQFKYGDPEYDITRREIISRRISGTMQADALVGFCLISGETNPDIIPTVNRMEAVDNQAFRDLKEFILFSMRRLDNRMNQDRDKLYENYKNKQETSARDLGKASKTLRVPKVQRALEKVGEDPEELLGTIKTAKDIVQGKIRQNVTESTFFTKSITLTSRETDALKIRAPSI